MEEKKDKEKLSLKKILSLDKQDREKDEKSKKQSFLKTIGPTNIIILLMVGVLLLILSLPNKTNNKEKEMSKESLGDTLDLEKTSDNKKETEIYVSTLEKRLEEVLSKVEGIGEVKVMITLKGSKELVILKDYPYTQEKVNESDTDGGNRSIDNFKQDENTIMIEGENGTKSPYVLKEIEPQVEGILIIASGGENAGINNQIIEASQVLFGVPAHKVKVMKMN